MMKISQEVQNDEAQNQTVQKGKHTRKNKKAKNEGEVRGNKNTKIRRKQPKQHTHKKNLVKWEARTLNAPGRQKLTRTFEANGYKHLSSFVKLAAAYKTVAKHFLLLRRDIQTQQGNSSPYRQASYGPCVFTCP